MLTNLVLFSQIKSQILSSMKLTNQMNYRASGAKAQANSKSFRISIGMTQVKQSALLSCVIQIKSNPSSNRNIIQIKSNYIGCPQFTNQLKSYHSYGCKSTQILLPLWLQINSNITTAMVSSFSKLAYFKSSQILNVDQLQTC